MSHLRLIRYDMSRAAERLDVHLMGGHFIYDVIGVSTFTAKPD
ncbi:hypothetical protein D2M30_2839 [Bacillus amyloliquefaciens]|nr:hypothetical protein D2M30_2839 [Bacillus amyloliquefaciens]